MKFPQLTSYSVSHLNPIQVIFVRAARSAALTKITVSDPSAKRYSRAGIWHWFRQAVHPHTRYQTQAHGTALTCLAGMIEQTGSITLLTDGERRYGNLLFIDGTSAAGCCWQRFDTVGASNLCQ